MSGFPAKFGPFTSGMNTASDPASIGDNELSDCVNFDLDLNGALKGRPPVTDSPGAVSWTERVNIIGFGVFTTGKYMIASNVNGTFYKLGGGAWITIAAGLKSRSMVQYGDKLFIVATPDSAVAGGSWSPSAGFTSLPAMPYGQSILVYKDRGFICPGETATVLPSRLYFSKATDLTDWVTLGVAGTVDVNPGDGQQLVDIKVVNDSVVCFKVHSTYVFSYALAPSTASLRNISQTIGVPTKYCVVSYQNNLYLFDEGIIFELVNFQFRQINTKVDFALDQTSPGTFTEPISLSIVGDRLIVRFYNKVYVFGLTTRTWARWESIWYYGRFVGEPNDILNSNSTGRYFAGSCVSNISDIFQINDGYDNTQSENMTCRVVTRYEDMSHHIRVGRYFISQGDRFKRLFWWSAEINTPNTVTGIVTPVVFNAKPTWGQVKQYTWAQILNNTWAQVTTTLAINKTTTAVAGSVRRIAKFPVALRFRLIYFEVQLPTNGTLADGPVQLHDIIALVASKEKVVAEIS